MASNMTFVMFGLLIVGILAGQWVLNSESFASLQQPQENSYAGLSAISGRVTENLTPSYSANVILAILFLIMTGYLLYRVQDRRYKLSLEQHLSSGSMYVSFILRLVLGAVFVWQAFNAAFYLNSIFVGIVYIITGLMLILGLFTRIAAYVAIFLLVYQLFTGVNPLLFIVLMANTVMVLIMGSGVPSIDANFKEKRA